MSDITRSGWLPFGSSDESVAFSHDLKSEIPTVITGFVTVLSGNVDDGFLPVSTGKTPQHDPILGMKSVDDVGNGSSYQLQSPHALTENAGVVGQLTIEVEKTWLETNDSIYSPDAYIPATQEVALSFLDDLSNAIFMTSKETSGQLQLKASVEPTHRPYFNAIPSGPDQPSPIFYGFSNDRFVTVNIAWSNGFSIAAIDGVIVGSRTELSDIKNRFANFFIGSGNGIENSSPKNHYIRNLQIANSWPNFSITNLMPYFGILSDSIFDDSQMSDGASGGTINPRSIIDKSFFEKGLRTHIDVREQNGSHISSTESNNHHTGLPLVLKSGMTSFIVQGGTNDAGSGVPIGTFESQYKLLIEKIMGVNGQTETTVKRLILLGPPSRFATGEAIQSIEDLLILNVKVILDLPSWWDSSYPLRAGQITVVNMFEILGGTNNAPNDVFLGQVFGNSNIHYAPKGNEIYGNSIKDEIWASA